MEKRDLELIERYSVTNEMLGNLYKEHVNFEHKLDKLNNKPYLTPSDELERKNLQKLKLKGRDMIEEILRNLRRQDSLS